MPEMIQQHDLEAEQSALGGMMLSRAVVWDVFESITDPADFYAPKHETIARAIRTLASSNQPTDPIAVGQELERIGQVHQAGGIAYLHELTSRVPTAANAGYYADIVSEKAVRRRLAAAGVSIVGMGSTGEGDPLEWVERARAEVDAVAGAARTEVRPVGDTLGTVIDSLTDPPRYVPTCWWEINDLIGGWRPGALYVVGARPGGGKSIFGVQAGLDLASHGALAISSLEMSEPELQKRLLSQLGEIHMSNLVNSTLEPSDWDRIASARNELAAKPIFVDDRSGVTITQIKSFARSVSRKGQLSGLVVDYLQLITGTDSRKPRHEVVGEISRELKVLAQDLQIPVIALSQLNRASEQRGRPTLADLRESGSIEQDADVVFLLSRDTENDLGHLLEVSIAKNRHGSTGLVELVWQGQYARLNSQGPSFDPFGEIRAV